MRQRGTDGLSEGYLSTGMAARRLGLSRHTVLRAIRDGALVPTHRTPGGYYRFMPSAVDAYARELAADRPRAVPRRAERAPWANEGRRTAALSAHAADLVAVVDPYGVICYASPSHLSILGHTPEEVWGRAVLDYVHPDDVDGVREAFGACVRTAQAIVTVELRLRHADGSWRAVESVMNNRLDDTDVGGIIVTSRDITARRRAEEELRASEERLRTVIANAPIALTAIDAEGVVTFSSGLGLSRLGRAPHSTVGQSIFEVLADAPDAREYVRRALAGESSTAVVQLGNVIFEARYAPVHDADGRVCGAVGVSTDVTERAHVEEALHLSEQRFAAFMDHMPAVAYMKDEQGRFAYINAAFERLFGVRPEGVRGATDDALFTPQAAAQNKANDRAVLTSGQSLEALETVPTPDGVPHHWMSYKFPIRTTAGTLLGGISIDVTERKRLEEELEANRRELERSNAELQQFAYVASHDLQEPLRTITSYLQLLKRRYRGRTLDDTADEFIGFATDGAARMSALIKAVLDYSRAGTMGVAFAPVDCTTLVGNAVANLEARIADTGARVIYDALPVVRGDAGQLGQLFQNLIGNALKFCRAAPEIRITAKRVGQEWVIAIRDNGIGIPADQVERVFAMFQRLHTREEYEGTGIGLAVCKRIVERHGGRVWVESELGQGATFFVALPAVPSQVDEAA